MAWHTLNKTLTGNNDQVTTTHIPVRQVLIFNDTGNGTLLVGDKNISATVYGFAVAAATVGPSIGPFSNQLPLNLEEIWLRGTNNNIVRIAYVT
jgi:hypothetical protein